MRSQPGCCGINLAVELAVVPIDDGFCVAKIQRLDARVGCQHACCSDVVRLVVLGVKVHRMMAGTGVQADILGQQAKAAFAPRQVDVVEVLELNAARWVGGWQ